MNAPSTAATPAVVACGLAFLVGCGGSPVSGSSPSSSRVASTAIPSASATPSPTTNAGTLAITQLGVTMQIPAGLTGITDKVEDPSRWSRQNASGATLIPVAAFGISADEWDTMLPASYACGVAIPVGSPEAYLTVWNVDPGTLPAQDAPDPGATPHLDNRWFFIEGAGPAGGPGACGNGQPYSPTASDNLASQQLPLLENMVTTVSAT